MKFWLSVLSAWMVLTAGAVDVKPLLISEPVPEVELKTTVGQTVNLRAMAGKQPLLIVFYRGSWCPYCSRHLAELQEIQPELSKLGFQIVAISPDSPENARKNAESAKLSFTLLSDSSMAAATAFGVAFEADEAMLKSLGSYNIDIEAASGQKHHLLPVPAVFFTGTNGKITYSYVNPDYTKRLEKELLLAAAKSVAETKK